MSSTPNGFNMIQQYQQVMAKAQQQPYSPLKRDYLWLLLIAVGLGACALAGYLFQGYHFAFAAINAFNPYFPEFVLAWMTSFGDTIFLLGLILIFATRRPQYHWTILFACIVGGLVINVLKDYFSMPRPPAVLELDSFYLTGRAYLSRSFPSGHSFTAFLVASMSFLYVRQCWQKCLLLCLAVLAALSRVLIGVHWVEDVLVGSALGILVGTFCVWVTCHWRFGVRKSVHLPTLMLMLLGAEGVFIVGNDYQQALPLMYGVAALALIQVIRYYLMPKSSDQT